MKGEKNHPTNKSPDLKTYVIEVLPISRGPHNKNTLTYFSTVRIPPGSLVNAPIRKSSIMAVVLSSRDAKTMKVNIRRSAYALRKISKRDITGSSFSSELLTALDKTAFYYAASTGQVIASLVSKFLLEDPALLSGPTSKSQTEDGVLPKEPLVIQMEKDERFSHYRSVIRQCFARKSSVLFVVPSIEEATLAYKSLSKGIDEYAFLVTSDTKKKSEVWQTAKETKHPVLFITTPIGIVFDRKDLRTIVLERESSSAYRTRSKPYIHIKTFLEHLALASRKDFILGDTVLSMESLWKLKEGKYSELSPVKWRLTTAPSQLVDMRAGQREDRQFEVLSSELKTLIARSIEEDSGILLYGARKGLSPTTVCGDCGSILSCKNCQAPLVLHQVFRETRDGNSAPKQEVINVYSCHACGARRSPETVCDRCKSWRLIPLGIGTTLIAEEVHKNFPNANVFILDKDHASTPAKARKIVRKFETQGGILVGTDMALFYLEKTPYAGVVSMDSLFSLPEFNAEERIFYLISKLKEMSTSELVIQTRRPGKDILNWANSGNIIDFYKSEISAREELAYPPFSIFIKISSTDKIPEIKELFEKWHPVYTRDSLIIRLPREKWPDQEIISALSLLSAEFSIKVDPESIL